MCDTKSQRFQNLLMQLELKLQLWIRKSYFKIICSSKFRSLNKRWSPETEQSFGSGLTNTELCHLMDSEGEEAFDVRFKQLSSRSSAPPGVTEPTRSKAWRSTGSWEQRLVSSFDVLTVVAGLCAIVACSWFAHNVIRAFYNPYTPVNTKWVGHLVFTFMF